VPTLKGTKDIVIPPGTQPGEVIRLRNEGVPYPKGARQGDLLVEVRVVIPRELTERQIELLKKLGESDPSGQTTVLEAPAEEGILHKIWNTVKHWSDQ
jgi:DnaJ-class molecular chaperone